MKRCLSPGTDLVLLSSKGRDYVHLVHCHILGKYTINVFAILVTHMVVQSINKIRTLQRILGLFEILELSKFPIILSYPIMHCMITGSKQFASSRIYTGAWLFHLENNVNVFVFKHILSM